MMKGLHIKFAFVFALLTVAGSAFGYDFTFTNVTNKWLVVQVKLSAWGGIYLNVVAPGRNAEFSWPVGNPRAGYCISSIRIAEYNKNIGRYDPYAQKGFDRMIIHERFKLMAQDTKQFGGQYLLLQHPLREVPIKWIPDKTWGMFDKTMRDAAEKLATGVADSLEKAIDLGIQAGTAGAGAPGAAPSVAGILSPLGSVMGAVMELMSKSKCVSRHFDIIETKKEGIMLATQQ
ncbi:MAG TPA: hypothetical protein VLB80_05065 [Candidatus Babeliales bacterium]|nr:hypothetical protein [Candidatus Babeliales bacterium]